jgi:STE24 endopeptidase
LSRIQLLLPLLMWALWHTYRAPARIDPWLGLSAYAAALLGVVAIVYVVAGQVERRIDAGRLLAAGRYHQALFAARWAVLLLHAGALFFGGLGGLVLRAAPEWLGAESPAVMLSTLPVLLAWAGLIWTGYRVDRATRERSVLFVLDAGLPVHAPPTLWQFLSHAVRTQILFTLLPVVLAIGLRDVLLWAVAALDVRPRPELELALALAPVGVVFLIAPELLRRILPTERLPDSPLREKLEAVCLRLNLRYRDILLWRTNHAIANAAVMGLVPQVRYVMLTDLLIETLDDGQIEAVFAHEAGHVVHRHITWFVVYAVLYFVWLAAFEGLMRTALIRFTGGYPTPVEVAMGVGGIVMFFVLLGLLSRGFERQADLFAARTLSSGRTTPAGAPDAGGVHQFNGALLRVAALNNMPLDARQMYRGRNPLARVYTAMVHHAATWLHGSIRARTEYLEHALYDPAGTRGFDRIMIALRLVLLLGAVTTTAWVAVAIVRDIR